VFGIRSAATAIATGNSVVLKASELSPRCYWAIGKAFHDAGLPHGVLNIITCPPERAAEIVDCMIEHPAVKKVNFTGSTSTGRKIASICGKNLKPCLMELGGKNSAIVLDDADVSKAVESCIVGSFLNVSNPGNELLPHLTKYTGWPNMYGHRPNNRTRWYCSQVSRSSQGGS
jgi:acyl-CoA reductase-like NAD-dependent aldehyde dehydrogenase